MKIEQLHYETEFKNKGFKNIVGIDEVGRGSLFGDVVACAIIMPDEKIEGVTDSKKLSEKNRNKFYELILNDCVAVGIGRVSPDIIDDINIKQATRLAMKLAVENLRDKNGQKVDPDLLLIDAEQIDLDIEQYPIVHGDEYCYSIACASIVAKVYRDKICKKWAIDYPNYGIEKHKGYGTKFHREAIKTYGATPLHRKSFVKNIESW